MQRTGQRHRFELAPRQPGAAGGGGFREGRRLCLPHTLVSQGSGSLSARAQELIRAGWSYRLRASLLPWVDGDEETVAFVDRWFGECHHDMLRALAFLMDGRRGARGIYVEWRSVEFSSPKIVALIVAVMSRIGCA